MKSSLILLAATLLAHSASTAIPPVILTEQGVKNLGLQTVVAEEADFKTTAFAFGRTEAIPERCSILSSRISGRVVEHHLRIGSVVSRGEKLLLLESRQPADPAPTVWLTAPANGTIISVNTKLGSPVEPSDRLAEIADLQTIYLIAKLPQTIAGAIGQGTQAAVRFPLRPHREYTATLLRYAACPCPDPACALGQDVSMRTDNGEDADLNTAGVIFTIENPDNQLRPGMNAECSIITETRENILSVPREAVQGSPSDRHVYVKHMSIPNAFDRVSVQIGMSNQERIEIIDGLLPGDEVVTRGAYSLGFAGSGGGPSLKEALDAAHGHEHNEDGSEKSAEQLAAAQAAGDHDHADKGIGMREMFFIAATGILAVSLIIVSARCRSTDDTSQLS